jgi:hypothetical protein
MAWGLWNKIKQGLRKVGSWVKDKIIKPVVNNVVKPFKPMISAAASAINPKIGAIVNTGMNMAEKWSDGERLIDKDTIKEIGGNAFSWANKRFGGPK